MLEDISDKTRGRMLWDPYVKYKNYKAIFCVLKVLKTSQVFQFPLLAVSESTGAGRGPGVAGACCMTDLEEVTEPLHHQPFTWEPTSSVPR